VACLLNARTVMPAETAIARKWLSRRHTKAATDTHVTVEELLEAVFSVRYVPSPAALPVSPSLQSGEESRESLQAES
jgi:hypothetical protein